VASLEGRERRGSAVALPAWAASQPAGVGVPEAGPPDPGTLPPASPRAHVSPPSWSPPGLQGNEVLDPRDVGGQGLHPGSRVDPSGWQQGSILQPLLVLARGMRQGLKVWGLPGGRICAFGQRIHLLEQSQETRRYPGCCGPGRAPVGRYRHFPSLQPPRQPSPAIPVGATPTNLPAPTRGVSPHQRPGLHRASAGAALTTMLRSVPTREPTCLAWQSCGSGWDATPHHLISTVTPQAPAGCSAAELYGQPSISQLNSESRLSCSKPDKKEQRHQEIQPLTSHTFLLSSSQCGEISKDKRCSIICLCFGEDNQAD